LAVNENEKAAREDANATAEIKSAGPCRA